MLRETFIQDVQDWDSLRDFCLKEGFFHISDTLIDESQMNDYVNSYIVENARKMSWQEIWFMLNELYCGLKWYILSPDDDWVYPADEEMFLEYKDEVLFEGDKCAIWYEH